jgi:BirA family biotin operon repressor/biotin-[acetyl-CoA-carboxylase] ligase
MNIDNLQQNLKTSLFGKYIYNLPEVESTNSYAQNLAREGAPEGTVVLAEYQTAGKGTHGRTWDSSAGVNILLSLILRPRLNIESAKCITLATADILITALEQFIEPKSLSLPFRVKWPNDILVKGKKIAGILTESAVKNKWFDYLIVGIGLNVNQEINELDENIREETTSLFAETQQKFEREKLTALILMVYETKYFELERTSYRYVVKNWKEHCDLLGSRIMVESPVVSETGQFIDVDNNGMLIYKTDEGEEKRLISGHIKYQGASNGTHD